MHRHANMPRAIGIISLLVLLAQLGTAACDEQQSIDQDQQKRVDASFVRIEKMRHQHFILPVTSQTDQATRREDRAMDPVAQRGVLLSRASTTLGEAITKTLETTRDNEFAKREARMRIQERMRSAGLMWATGGEEDNK